MNRYTLIKGFDKHAEAAAYAEALPPEAVAKVVPFSIGKGRYLFAVYVIRSYTSGRL